MTSNKATDRLWDAQPEVIRKFLDLRPNHEKLCEEVTYILKKLLQEKDLEYSAVTWRAKNLDSFCEKLGRKKYDDPFKEVTDLAGVRLVYLYGSDQVAIEKLIEREFKIIEKVDKIEEVGPEQFGYGALHYLVHLGKRSVGARYDDLKDLVCEIQVRTILQDAWATIAHHLSYKQESDVPKELRRRLNALSGLFETADDQFIQLRDERTKYSEEMKHEISLDAAKSLQQKVNLDNLIGFLEWRFPNREMVPETVPGLLKDIQRFNYETLADLDRIVDQTEEAVKAFEKQEKEKEISMGQKVGTYTAIGALRVGMYFVNKEFCVQVGLEKKMEKFRDLVKPAS
jgi:ppGpp synthetase/RelA/SpoT-type nucleotidyltranferase